jgi:hypothetical protein
LIDDEREGYILPVDTTWETVFEYYRQQATGASWASESNAVAEVENGKIAVYAKGDSSAFVLVFAQGTDKVETLAAFGKYK